MAQRQSQSDDRAARLLDWYDRNGRALPWRAPPGETSDPYHVWLSEIMLQQTTVATVRPRFARFIQRWPDFASLAAAPLDDVLHEWQGLGYYARARNLHRCAVVVAQQYGGRLPGTEDALAALPGIGRYTAAAIAAIAFGRRAVVVDGNVERVMARLHAVDLPLPDAKPALYDHAETLTPDRRPGDYAQAVMDLGATICTPRNPACGICPWQDGCAGRRAGIAADLPRKRAKAKRPTRHGVAFWVRRSDGAVLLRRRPEKGLLGGMMEIPSTEWVERHWTAAGAMGAAPVDASWRKLPGAVSHTFTHFHLELTVMAAEVADGAAADGGALWWPVSRLDEQALPTVMKKVVRHVLEAVD